MKAKDFLTESQYQQYRMLFEMDPSRRGFLKTLGKGALGVAGAAAMSAMPFSKAVAQSSNVAEIVAIVERRIFEKWLGGFKFERLRLVGHQVAMSDSFDDPKVEKGNGMISFKATGICRHPKAMNQPVDGYVSCLMKKYNITQMSFKGKPLDSHASAQTLEAANGIFQHYLKEKNII